MLGSRVLSLELAVARSCPPVKIGLSGSTYECVVRRPFDWGKNDFGNYWWCTGMFADISDQRVETEWYLVLFIVEKGVGSPFWEFISVSKLKKIKTTFLRCTGYLNSIKNHIRGVIRKFAENSCHFYIIWSVELEFQHTILQHKCSWSVTPCLMLVVYVRYCCRQGNAL